MIHLNKTLLFWTIFICFQSLSGQSYRPFVPNLTYTFECTFTNPNHFPTSPDPETLKSFYSLKIDSAFEQGLDSIFVFNKIRTPYFNGTLSSDIDNIMGINFLETPNGEYHFTAQYAGDVIIKTQIPLQTSWVYQPDSGTTATLIDRSEKNFLGVTDSVLTILLSTGDTILLSKNYGLIQAQRIFPISRNYHKLDKDLTLYGIEEIGLGTKMPWFEEIFDFELGEKFYSADYPYCEDTGPYTITSLKVIDRWDSPNQDTITYSMEREQTYVFPYWVDPDPSWWDTSYLGIDTLTVPYYKVGIFADSNRLLSNEFKVTQEFETGIFNYSPSIRPEWGNRLIFEIFDYMYWGQYESGGYRQFGVGLGSITTRLWPYRSLLESICTDCIQKTSQTMGPCLTPELVVSNENQISSLTFEVNPNPFSQNINVNLCTTRIIGKWSVNLLNTNGQLLLAQSGQELNSCLEQSIDLSRLSTGMYILKLHIEGSEYSIFKKIVKQ